MAGCTICQRPDVAAINAALAAGEGLGHILKRFRGVSKTTLRRHRDGCAGTGEPPAENPAKGKGKPPPGTVPHDSRTPEGSKRALEREGRVRFIMDLMASQRWEQDSAERYAQEWGVHPGTVTSYAGEAGRRLVAMDDPAYQKRVGALLDELLDVAMTAARTGDPKAIGAAAQVFRVHIEKGRAVPVADKPEAPPTFKIDLSLPVRPPAEEPN